MCCSECCLEQRPPERALPTGTIEVPHKCAKDIENLIASTQLAGCAAQTMTSTRPLQTPF
jgi:hypothetical protein